MPVIPLNFSRILVFEGNKSFVGKRTICISFSMNYLRFLFEINLDELTQRQWSMSLKKDPTHCQRTMRYIGIVFYLIQKSFANLRFELTLLINFTVKIAICNQFSCLVNFNILLWEFIQDSINLLLKRLNTIRKPYPCRFHILHQKQFE